MSTYREYQPGLAATIPWLADPVSRAYFTALGRAKDALLRRTVRGVEARFAELAPEDALLLLGLERGLPRVPGEYIEAYRRRVLGAFEFWDFAGTVPGIIRALEHLGYGVQLGTIRDAEYVAIVEGILAESERTVTLQTAEGSFETSEESLVVAGERFEIGLVEFDPAFRYFARLPTRVIEYFGSPAWAEFDVFISPTEPVYTTDRWDDGTAWDGDDTRWDVTIGQYEPERIRAVLNTVKPAHAVVRNIYLVGSPTMDYWNDGTTWDDGSVWGGEPPVKL